jgi:HAE1 family hydrophobic/amphiphilic exporter-1
MALCYMLIALLGWVFWQQISVELRPDVSLPSFTVSYQWGRTSPEVMEREITRKVEALAGQLRNVAHINSVTEEGVARVNVEMEKSAPIDFRIVEMGELLEQLREELPSSVRRAPISKRVPESLEEKKTFMSYSVSGSDNRFELLEWARRSIKMPLSGMSGISEVQLSGVNPPALTIRFDPIKIEQYGLSVARVMSDLRDQFTWTSAGFTQQTAREFSLVLPPQLRTLQDVRGMPVELAKADRTLRLEDVAQVEIADYPTKRIRRVNGKPALTISLQKAQGADALNLADQVETLIQEVKQTAPADYVIHKELDTTRELRDKLAELSWQSKLSFLLVFVILLLMIREIRAPLIILSSIVLSVLMSIGLLYLIGYSLNLFTMAAITIALGMIVDNAIVVYEHIRPSLPEERDKRIPHVSRHLPDVIVPVMGNTLTTIGIFVPLLFALDEISYFLEPVGIALSLTLISSVVISLTWIPYTMIWLVGSVDRGSSQFQQRLRSWFSWSSSLKSVIKKRLRRKLLWLMGFRYRLRWVVYLALLFTLGIPLYLIPSPEDYMADQFRASHGEDTPQEAWYAEYTQWYFAARDLVDPVVGGLGYQFYSNTYFGEAWSRGKLGRDLTIYVQTPTGTPIEEIDKIARNFEKIAAPYEHAMSYFETEVSEFYGARIQFRFKEDYLMEPEPYYLKGESIYLAARTGNSAISVSGFGQGFSTGFGGGGSNFRFELTGYSYEQLEEMALQLKRRIEKNPRVRNVDIAAGYGWGSKDQFQHVLRFNDLALHQKGLSRYEVVREIRPEINPQRSYGKLRLNGRQVELVAHTQTDERRQSTLMEQVRQSGKGVVYNLDEVASLQQEKVLDEIRKEDQEYIRIVSFEFLGPYRFGNEFAKSVMEEFPEPIGTSISMRDFGSLWGSGNEANYGLIFLMAVVMVWMIVSALLERWSDPLIILLVIPMSWIGIMGITLYMDLAFGQAAFAGLLLVSGVAVNNAILLLHGNHKYDALGVGGLRKWYYTYGDKLRSILLTTLTTIAGLLPMIFWAADPFWETLAYVVIAGLAVSTTLILLLAGIWTKPKLNLQS